MKKYQIIIHSKTHQSLEDYRQAIIKQSVSMGAYLEQQLSCKQLEKMTIEQFLGQLIQTKHPQIFAESEVYGDGSDWTQQELSLLGNIGIAVPVCVYDNGRHYFAKIHKTPFNATLLYTPGALLRNDGDYTPADLDEVTEQGVLDFSQYYSLYERRLLPQFLYANQVAETKGKKVLLTLPGIGCGQFAGKFRGQMGDWLKKVIIELITHYCEQLQNITAIYFDPYQECDNERFEIGGISLLVRPLTQGNNEKSQLCHPTDYEENGDDFSQCELFSVVAWDPVSWPGNDFFLGDRMTDDGVKAAATDSMSIITGVEGSYNALNQTYDPPPKYRIWENVVKRNNIQLQVNDNLMVFGGHPKGTSFRA